MYVDHDEAIASADWIALVEIENWIHDDDRNASANARVIDYIKGKGKTYITIANPRSNWARFDEDFPAESNFYDHKASAFWMGKGRNANYTDCLIHPGLYLGKKYLVFGDHQMALGYEQIGHAQNDAWLSYVKKKVSEETATKPFPTTADRYLERAKAVVRVTGKIENGVTSWDQIIYKGPERDYLRYVYISPHVAIEGALRENCNIPSYVRKENAFDFVFVFESLPTSNIQTTQYDHCAGEQGDIKAKITATGQFSRFGHMLFSVVQGEIVTPFGDNTILTDELTFKKLEKLR